MDGVGIFTLYGRPFFGAAQLIPLPCRFMSARKKLLKQYGRFLESTEKEADQS